MSNTKSNSGLFGWGGAYAQTLTPQGKANEQTGHTPGPWRYHLGRGTNPRFHIQTEGSYQIASTTELERGHTRAHEINALREANARLIAAAPELLEACKLLLTALTNSDAIGGSSTWGRFEVTRELAQEAIAKAEGRS